MTDMGKEELLQELAYLDQAEYIDKQAYAQLRAIVEQYFHPEIFTILKRMGFKPDYEQMKADAQKAEAEGVEEVWKKEFEEIVEAEDLSPSNRSALALDMVKQLLTHSSTSGNDMSDKRTVTIESISKFVDKEWEDAGYDILTTPETYEVKAMIADFIQQELDIEVEDEDGD